MKLKLSEKLSLPLEAVSRTFGILAARGAGKSNTAAVMAEEMFAARLPFVVIDPVGAWYGLRSSPDGTGPGLPIPIFGGKHGDVPIERDSGELIADLIVEKRLTCVIDLSQFESETSKKRFLLAFARRLYQKNENPLHLFLEEADDYIPQKPMGNDENYLLRAWENIVRRGRSRGLGMTMITQRSAAINKMVLTQVETLFAMRTTGPQDIAAIEAWIKYNQESKDVLGTLSSLGDGEAWVWSPHFLQVMARYQIRRRHTFDSGATPTNMREKDARAPATLADVDLVSLREKMAATVEKAKADDPALLRRKIIELEKRVASLAVPPKGLLQPEEIEEIRTTEYAAGRTCERKDIARKIVASFDRLGAEIKRAALALEASLEDTPVRELIGFTEAASRAFTAPFRPVAVAHEAARTLTIDIRRNGKASAVVDTVRDGVTGPEQRILDGIAWMNVLGVESPSTDVVAFLARYSPSSTSFTNPRGALRTRGLIHFPSTGTIALTERGAALANVPTVPTTDEELQRRVMERLDGPCRRILAPLIDTWPKAIATEKLAELAEYSATSTSFTNPRGRLRTLGLVEFPQSGHIRASDLLFPVSAR